MAVCPQGHSQTWASDQLPACAKAKGNLWLSWRASTRTPSSTGLSPRSQLGSFILLLLKGTEFHLLELGPVWGCHGIAMNPPRSPSDTISSSCASFLMLSIPL